MSEFSRLRGNERYEACEDDVEVARTMAYRSKFFQNGMHLTQGPAPATEAGEYKSKFFRSGAAARRAKEETYPTSTQEENVAQAALQVPSSRLDGAFVKGSEAAKEAGTLTGAFKALTSTDSLVEKGIAADVRTARQALFDSLDGAALAESTPEQRARQEAAREELSRVKAEQWNVQKQGYYASRQAAHTHLRADSSAAASYDTAQELEEDMRTIQRIQNGLYLPEDVPEHLERLAEKYGLRQETGAGLEALYQTLGERLEEAKAAVSGAGHDYDRLNEYDTRLRLRAEAEEKQAEWAKYARENPALASGAALMLSPMQIIDAAKKWGQGARNLVLGETIPLESSDMDVTNLVNTLKGTVAEEIAGDETETNPVRQALSFLYQTGMSIGENAALIATMGPAARFIMGSNVSAQATKETLDSGGSNQQALLAGLAAGVAELAFESIGIEKLLAPKNPHGWRQVVAEVLKQAGVEAGEEGLTSVANLLSEAAILGERSDYHRRVEAYLENGETASRAELLAFLDDVKGVALDSLGGAISGGVMQGGKLLLDKATGRNVQPLLHRDSKEGSVRDVLVETLFGGDRQTERGKITPRSVENDMDPIRIETDPSDGTKSGVTVQDGITATPEGSASNDTTILQTDGRVYHGKILDTVRAHLPELQQMDSVATLTGQEFQRTSSDTRSLREKVIDFFNSIGNKVTRTGMGEIELNTSGVRDSLAHGYGKLKAATFAALPQILERGRLVEHRGPYEGHGYDSYLISAPVQIGNETVYVGALVIKDRKQRYKLHEVLTTNESGVSLFKSETNGQGAAGPLRNDTPLEASGDASADTTIPQSESGVKGQFPQGDAENSVGAAARGFTVPEAVRQERSSRMADTSLIYNRHRADAAALTSREAWNDLFRYETRSEAESLQLAQEQLWFERDGERVFLADLSPESYKALTEELRGANAWNGVMTDLAHMIETELLGRSERGEITSEEYVDWVKTMRAHATATGQGVQAEAKWSRTGNEHGERTMRDVWGELEKSNRTEAEKEEAFSAVLRWHAQIEAAKSAQDLRSIILDISEQRGVLNGALTKRQSRALRTAAERALNGLESGDLKQFAYATAAALTQDAAPVSIGRKLKTVQILNMLSNPKTAMKNLAGNATFYGLDAMTMRAAALADMALSQLTGTRSIAMEPLFVGDATAREAALRAVRMSIAEATLDVDMGSANRYQGNSGRTFKAGSDNVLERILSAAERNQQYLLTVPDELFKGMARSTAERTARLIDEGKIKPVDGQQAEHYAQDQADALAKYRTFQVDGKGAEVLQTIRDVCNSLLGVGDSGKRTAGGRVVHDFGLGDLVAPFTKVAANLAGVGVDYGPANVVKGAAELFLVLRDAAGGRSVDPAKQAKALRDSLRGMTGTALALGVSALAKAGLVRRADDEDDKDVARLNRSEGLTGAQVNVTALQRLLGGESPAWQAGDTLLDVSNLEPLNFIINLGFLLSDNENEGLLSTVGEMATDTVGAAVTAAGDLPVVSTIADFAKDVAVYGQDPLFAGAEALGRSAISSVTPNWVAALAKGMDSKQRNLYAAGSDQESAAGKFGSDMLSYLMSRTPGLRQQLPGVTDVTGEEKDNPGTLARRLAQAMLNPVGVNRYEQSEMSRELERVRNATAETDFYPTDRSGVKSLSYTDRSGEKHEVTLNYEQRQQFQRDYAAAHLETTAGMMGCGLYRNADAQTQADLLKRCKDYSYEYAKGTVLGEEAVSRWVRNAQTSRADCGLSQAEYLYYYEKYGAELMSGAGYERTCRMAKAGVDVDTWAGMHEAVDADGSGGVTKAELTQYIEDHFPRQAWSAVFDAYNGNGKWKNPYE